MGFRARHRDHRGQAGMEYPYLSRPGRRRRRPGANLMNFEPGEIGEKLPNKTIEINGGNVVYEILGKQGDFIALTPGGRFSKDIPGLKPLARALVNGGYRVLLWDRPTCGKSDVQFYGLSQSHMRAETVQQLITKLDIGPCIIAGGSGGA